MVLDAIAKHAAAQTASLVSEPQPAPHARTRDYWPSSASIYRIATAQCHWIGHEEKGTDVADWLAACNFLYLSIRSLILNNHQSHRRDISRRDRELLVPRNSIGKDGFVGAASAHHRLECGHCSRP
jgi:hypothetical protein